MANTQHLISHVNRLILNLNTTYFFLLVPQKSLALVLHCLRAARTGIAGRFVGVGRPGHGPGLSELRNKPSAACVASIGKEAAARAESASNAFVSYSHASAAAAPNRPTVSSDSQRLVVTW